MDGGRCRLLFPLHRRTMNNRQQRVIDAAESSALWARGLENAPLRVTKAAERLQEAVDEAGAASAAQLNARNARRAPRCNVTLAKTILIKKHLQPIATDGIVLLAGLPGIKETLRIPRIKDGPDAHLKAAERLRRVAEEHEQEFIRERHYRENFLERFDKAVDDLRAAAQVDRGSARAKYSRTTKEVENELTHLRAEFNALESTIIEAYMEDRTVLETWRQVSRIKAKTGRPRRRRGDD